MPEVHRMRLTPSRRRLEGPQHHSQIRIVYMPIELVCSAQAYLQEQGSRALRSKENLRFGFEDTY